MGIAAGPDGNLWTTEVLRAGPSHQDSRALTGTFTLPPDISPFGITAGPDGNMWFTESGYDSIGRITPGGAIAIISTGVSLDSDPRDITTGPDGNLWFTEQSLDQIGRITPSIELPVVGAGEPTAITTTSATLNGTVDAAASSRSRASSTATTAYGSQTTVQFVADTVAEPVVAALTGLQPKTTYHYRLVAAGGGGSAQSADRTFTTAAVAPPPPRRAAACSTASTMTATASPTAPTRAVTPTPIRATPPASGRGHDRGARRRPARVCARGGLALVSAERTRARAGGSGCAASPTPPRPASGSGCTRPAGARHALVCESDGSFTASLAAPRRGAAGLRYQARLGTQRSQSLAAQRRLAGVRLSVASGQVVLSGRTVGRRPRSVELLGRGGGCGNFTRLATAG